MKTIIGVMGPGEGAGDAETRAAFELGALVAREGWPLLTGGRAAGVMDAASRGAKSEGGLVIGVLPGETTEGASESIDVAIVTGLGEARNNVNVLTSRVVVACGAGAGTASEIALALKAKKSIILLRAGVEARAFFASLGGGLVFFAETPREAVEIARRLIETETSR